MKTKMKLIAVVVGLFLIIDIVGGLTYNFANVGSIIYLTFVILLIAGILSYDSFTETAVSKLFAVTSGVIVISLLIGGLMSAKFLNAKRYAAVIGDVDEMSFQELYGKDRDIEMSYVDKDSAQMAADKKLGELSDLSARFVIDHEEFSQINYQGKMIRIAPFEYTDSFKKYTSIGQGVPYYIMVHTGDSAMNAKAEIVTLEEGMNYYPGAPLLKDLHRHVAMRHKFSYLDDYFFEIDDEGNPYWIVQVIRKRVGLWGSKDMQAIITVDAITGDTQRYDMDSIPKWVDTVYPTDMLMNQAKNYYKFSGGYLNALFAQRGVMAIDSEEGDYNYVMIDGEIYIFTGIRPHNAESNSTTGLLFMSKRTGESIEMELPGVSIPSAELTSIGGIQEKGYRPTTPVLQNINGFPTYVMSLKDQSGVVRGFSFVNYQDYTKSAVGDNYESTEKNYLNVMGDSESLTPDDQESLELVISDIVAVTIDGNTQYLITFEGREEIYSAPIKVSFKLAFAKVGDNVKVLVQGSRIIEFE